MSLYAGTVQPGLPANQALEKHYPQAAVSSRFLLERYYFSSISNKYCKTNQWDDLSSESQYSLSMLVWSKMTNGEFYISITSELDVSLRLIS